MSSAVDDAAVAASAEAEASEVAGSAAVAAEVPEEVERVVAGDPVTVSEAERVRIHDAVEGAESKTGLEFCVYLGPADEDTRGQAEAMFVEAGLLERPAVLLLVAPDQRKIEIVTAPDARERLTDDECAASIAEMAPYFARDEYVEGLEVGLRALADRTGPGTAHPDQVEVPNVLDRYQALATQALTASDPTSRIGMLFGAIILALLLGTPIGLLIERMSSAETRPPTACFTEWGEGC
jgi:uncharacterized membrane protein YgcG